MAVGEEDVKSQNQKKGFLKSGHFFRDFSLLLIFGQIVNEFIQVWNGFDDMTYAMVILTKAVGEIWPFAIRMSWCLVLICMFVFTLGGGSRWPLTIQIFITIILTAKYVLFKDYLWAGLMAASIIVYYAAVREVRRREVRRYVADLLPGEKDMPLWVMILVFIALNGAFTYPAWNRYSERLRELDIDYRQMISDMVDQVVERIMGEKTAVMKSLEDFSSRMQKMAENAGKAIDMPGIMSNIQQGTDRISENVRKFMDSNEVRAIGDYFRYMFSGEALTDGLEGSFRPSVVQEPAVEDDMPAERKIRRPAEWE